MTTYKAIEKLINENVLRYDESLRLVLNNAYTNNLINDEEADKLLTKALKNYLER